MNKKRIAILGYGTVGRGVVEALENSSERVKMTTGLELELVGILKRTPVPDDPYSSLIYHEASELLKQDLDLVIECMGGIHPAFEYTKAALEAGISVVSSNKVVIAEYGVELMALALKNDVYYRFEAAVGGGIPVIRTIHRELRMNKITSLLGNLNGTVNYILTEMGSRGIDYQTALKATMGLGYAEPDPNDDVEGYDARRKLAILSSFITGEAIPHELIPCRGITSMQPEDFSWAKELGYHISLLGVYKDLGDRFSLEVSPFYLHDEHPMSMVRGVFNGILFHGDLSGDLLLYGEGAGGLATASAILEDVVQIFVTTLDAETKQYMCWDEFKDPSRLLTADELSWTYALRFNRDRLRGNLKLKRLLMERAVLFDTRGGAPGTLAITKDKLDGKALEELLELSKPDQYLPIYEVDDEQK